MSVAAAKAYMTRMREDETFRNAVHACEDEAANWAFLRQNGYEFNIDEFNEAQAALSDKLSAELAVGGCSGHA